MGFVHAKSQKRETRNRAPSGRPRWRPISARLEVPQSVSAGWGRGHQAWEGGPRGAAARWWAPLAGATRGAHGGVGEGSLNVAKQEGSGGGGRPPCERTQSGQCPSTRVPGAGGPSGSGAGKVRAGSTEPANARKRGPPLVQTSRPWAGPWADASAWVRVGDSAAKATRHTASQAHARQRSRTSRGIRTMINNG